MRDRLRDFGLGQAVVHADIGMTRELSALTIRDQCADRYETAVTRRQVGAQPQISEQDVGCVLRHARKYGAELISDDATALDLTGDIKTVEVGGETYRARAVILAMGSAYRYLGLPNEERLLGHGVSACATCDGFFFRNQQIAVVGGGDSAMEEATFLTRFAEKVYLIHRRDAFRASRIMVDRALANDKIEVVYNTVVEDVLGEDKVAGLAVRNVVSGEGSTLDVTGMFVAIGHDPRSELVRGQVDLDPAGYVLVDAPSTRTNLSGVFACGDLVDHVYRQAITAAGTGCAAALDAERWLEAQHQGAAHAAE